MRKEETERRTEGKGGRGSEGRRREKERGGKRQEEKE